jgi:hypothetical protein
MWCWRRNVLHTVKRRKANWIGHILHRNCLINHVIEGKMEGRTEVTGRKRKLLLDEWMTPGNSKHAGN